MITGWEDAGARKFNASGTPQVALGRGDARPVGVGRTGGSSQRSQGSYLVCSERCAGRAMRHGAGLSDKKPVCPLALEGHKSMT